MLKATLNAQFYVFGLFIHPFLLDLLPAPAEEVFLLLAGTLKFLFKIGVLDNLFS